MSDNKKELSNIAFSRDAADYDQSSKYASLRASYSTIVAEALSEPTQSVLDIGCGTGALLSLIQEQNKTAQVFGIDLSGEMIKIAKAKLGKDVDLRVSDSEKLPFKNESFDVVTCTFSFHHYPNALIVLSEMRRVLKKSGKLIVADPLAPAPLRQLLNLFIPWRKDGTVRYYSKREMCNLIESAGLEIFKWSKLNWHSYMLVGRHHQVI